MLPPVIALTGFKGSGKSTVANTLIRDLGYERVAFAGPLKDMLVTMGLSPEQVWGDQKETPSEILCGNTPRHAMQTLGTEWGRQMIGPDVWVKAWYYRVLNNYRDKLVVVDDARFDNEIAAVRRLGGKVILISRPGHHGDGHASEKPPLFADAEFLNSGTINAIVQSVLLKLQIWNRQ